jgi:hypothetical protein
MCVQKVKTIKEQSFALFVLGVFIDLRKLQSRSIKALVFIVIGCLFIKMVLVVWPPRG